MADGGRPDRRETLGSAMVLIGLVFFLIVFVALFPVLTNPAGAYDRWFPSEVEDQIAPVEQPEATLVLRGPTAQFRWEAVTVEQIDPPIYRLRLTSESTAGDSELVSIRWTLGDGSTALGESVTHDYSALGSYTIGLRVEDATGRFGSVRGTVTVAENPSLFGSAGRVEDTLAFDGNFDSFGDGISDSLEGAVGDVGDDITETLDSALGSIGTTVRGSVVVVLFALAALAATIVAWRTARIGVMLLSGDFDVRSRRTNSTETEDDEDLPGRRGLEAV